MFVEEGFSAVKKWCCAWVLGKDGGERAVEGYKAGVGGVTASVGCVGRCSFAACLTNEATWDNE